MRWMDLTDHQNDLRNDKKSSQVVLESKNSLSRILDYAQKKAQFHQKLKKRVEHRLLIKCPCLTFQISAADARERNHRMTNFRDCWFQTEKPKSFCPVFELMWHKNPIIFCSAWSLQVLTVQFLDLFQNSSPESNRACKFITLRVKISDTKICLILSKTTFIEEWTSLITKKPIKGDFMFSI